MKTIPKRYEGVDIKDVPKNIKSKFDTILQKRKGIYLWGPVGTGKTHLAFAMKKEWDENHSHKVTFWNTSELMQEIKDDFDRHPIDKTRVFERMMEEKNLLILDDIGSEKLTDWVLERFYLIINRRYNDVLPIIFTSNFNIEKLAERLGDRVASRIVEMCDIEFIGGDDKRIKS